MRNKKGQFIKGISIKTHPKDCGCCVCMTTRGDISYNLGRVQSKETKEKIRKKLKNRKMPEETKQKIRETMKRRKISVGKNNANYGKKPWNYKGTTPLYKRIRNSEESKQWQWAISKRDGYRCQDCFSSNNLRVHHIKHFSDIFQEFLSIYDQFSPMEDLETLVRLSTKYKSFWDIDNGITLCAKCHSKEHRRIRSKF